MNRPELDFGLYFFGNYSKDVSAGDAYETLFSAARFADERGFSSLWVPERHFHSFGGIFPNPSVLAAALSRETFRIRLNAGSVVLPLHDVIRVAEEWSVVDNMSGGRVGIGCATGWDAEDFVFYPDRFGRHREIMYAQLSQLRKLWRGQSIDRVSGSGEDTAVSLRPRPVQAEPPMYVAVLGRRESFADAARHDLGIITNLMAQDVGTLADNIAYYRDTRARNGLDPQAGKVTVLMHTYLDPDADAARDAAFGPLCEHMRTSKSLFGRVINSLGFEVDPDNAEADDLTYLFERAYHRFCAGRTLVGSPESCAPMAAAVRDAGVDEIAALVDFGVPSDLLLAGLGQVEALRGKLELAPPSTPEAAPEPDVEAPRESIAVASASQPSESFPLSAGQRRLWLLEQRSPE
ncbi:MAG: MupA/Atu3671 family FMN-dependent luciferase-like monooxygenase, partial [Stackebrandtia sp.]